MPMQIFLEGPNKQAWPAFRVVSQIQSYVILTI